MSRARGNDPSKSPALRRHLARLRRDFSSTFDYVKEASEVYSEFASKRALFDSRAAWYRFLPNRPKTRVRTSGPVGPEVDMSVLNSDVSFDMLKHVIPGGKSAFHIFPARSGFDTRFTPMCNNHGCVQTCFMSRVHAQRWTALAMEFGIEFDGQHGYRLPKRSFKDVELSFRSKRALGMIPEHRRSDLAKIRRAARRGKANCEVRPFPVSSLFTTRYRLSSKQIHERWFNCRKTVGLGFQDFKSTVPRGQCLNVRRHRGEIPLAVYLSIGKLYSSPVYYRKEISATPLPPETIRITLPVPGKSKPLVLKAGAAVDFYTTTGHKSIFHSTIPRIDPRVQEAMDLVAMFDDEENSTSRDQKSSGLTHSRLRSDFQFSDWN